MLDATYRAGDWVQVRSAEEILATLDAQGCLEALPFMPEMLQYCGKRFRVFRSAHKACDTLGTNQNRRMHRAVHLDGLRCDGSAHGGCQAACLIFWKEAWLTPAEGDEPTPLSARTPGASAPASGNRCDASALARATRAPGAADTADVRFKCQATEMFRATSPLRWWDPRQYAKDLRSRNIRLRDFVRYGLLAAYNMLMRRHWRLRPYPYVSGRAESRTPTAKLDLQPGEWVRVRSRAEIMETLVAGGNRNRGLSFDVEMVPYCGKTFRVLSRVDRIIEERTGKFITLPGPCVILEGVTCSGCLSKGRLFCPRSIYPYWREVWLTRVEAPQASMPPVVMSNV